VDFRSYRLTAPKKTGLSYKLRNPIEQASTALPGSNDFISSERPKDYGGGAKWSKFEDMACSVENELEESQYLLLPGFLLGFSLGRKEWSGLPHHPVFTFLIRVSHL
jgi:hypothetical protein